MADIKDFKNKNTKFTGTEGIVLPSGTSAERPSGTVAETRYNTDTGSLEFYDGANWVATNLIPTVDSISGDIYAGATSNLTLTLSNATDNIDVVYSEGGIELAQDTGVSVSSGSATTAVPAAVYGQTAGDTITISIKNQDGTPSSNSVTRTVISLPTGGTIYTFGSYRVHAFTGTQTFTNTLSTNLTADVLVVAGGGGGGVHVPGGGGAGGLIYRPGITITPGNYTMDVGGGGSGAYNPGGYSGMPNASVGGNSTAFGLTALGGGFGGSWSQDTRSNNGGSGGGRNSDRNSGQRLGLQPSQGGDSGTYGFGNNGALNSNPGNSNYGSGGGGGAGEAPPNAANKDTSGRGGNGRDYSAQFGTTYGESGVFAGGGEGGGWGTVTLLQGGTGGGGDGDCPNGGGGSGDSQRRGSGEPTGYAGQANTGGGGGGAGRTGGDSSRGGNGGSGIILVRYQL